MVLKIFPDVEVDDGVGGTNAICSRQEVVNDVISGYNIDFSGLPCYEFISLLASMVFQKIVIIHLCGCLFATHFWMTMQTCLMMRLNYYVQDNEHARNVADRR